MDDLISRQTAIDALGERPMAWTDNEYDLGCVNQYDLDRLAIETVPSADAVEVVRCRDCKYYDLAKNGVNGICNRQYATFDAYDFCSYGERK